jgi:hypothetical protein
MACTIFLDIDGTILEHPGSAMELYQKESKALIGTHARLEEWERDGHKIILTTGRRESMRAFTEGQLRSLGIAYDQLIMGLGRGPRIIINDAKPDSNQPTAIGITLTRNEGLGGVELGGL